MDIRRVRKNKTRPSPALPDIHLRNNRSSDYSGEPEKDQSVSKKHLGKKTILFFFVFVFLIFAASGVFVLGKAHFVSKKIIISSEQKKSSVLDELKSVILPIFRQSNIEKLKSDQDGRINIALLGIAGKGKPGQNLTDTIMIMSVNTKTNQVGFLSLPRDFYLQIPQTNQYSKINSLYQYGINNGSGERLILEAIKTITGLDPHYFLIMDFEGFEKIIDDIGGINVYVERDIYDSRYPGPNYSYETFEIKKGLHHLDGKTALKYARERHSDPLGDFGRAKRQQQVIQTVKNRVFSLETFLNVFTLNKMIDTLGEHIKTNIRLDEIEGFIALSQRVDSQNISSAVVDAWKKDSLLKVAHIDLGGVQAFALVPRVGNYSEIQDLAENLFDLEKIKRREQEIEKENARLAVINYSSAPWLENKIKKTLEEDLGFKNIKIIQSDNNIFNKTTDAIDLSENKPFSLDEVIKKIPATRKDDKGVIIKDSYYENYDIIIALGDDIVKFYDYEEGTIEEMINSGQ